MKMASENRCKTPPMCGLRAIGERATLVPRPPLTEFIMAIILTALATALSTAIIAFIVLVVLEPCFTGCVFGLTAKEYDKAIEKVNKSL